MKCLHLKDVAVRLDVVVRHMGSNKMSLIKIISSFARDMFLGHTHTHTRNFTIIVLWFNFYRSRIIPHHIVLIKISTIYLF
jgi:hypothetical protein